MHNFCIISVPPLFVIEFLHRVVDTFEDYFSECSENVVKDNYVVVYEVNYIITYEAYQYCLSVTQPRASDLAGHSF